MTVTKVTLGYAIGVGDPVSIPIAHMAVTGMTQASGKTTTLEALVKRSGLRALAFVTKRGESSFGDGHRHLPYFRDRADWQFVTSIIDATLQEKNKFLRPWIMKICQSTNTLQDVQRAVRKALVKAKGINEGVYTQLDEYLNMIVPEIERAKLVPEIFLRPGVNVMDVSSYATPMQMLFVQSALDWINDRERDTIVVIPEAWEFIPEGKGSPVKASATTLVRKGAALRNFVWVDSQDMAGVDKVILRGCTVWLIGVQREANEIKRTLSNIPKGVASPTASDIALLSRGQFVACWERHAIPTYVQPAWVPAAAARAIATGERSIDAEIIRLARQSFDAYPEWMEDRTVNEAEARDLRQENADLKGQIDDLRRRLDLLLATNGESATVIRNNGDKPMHPDVRPAPGLTLKSDMDAVYAEIVRRARSDPGVLQLLTQRPEIVVKVERVTIDMDGKTAKGRIAKLLAEGFYDDGNTNGATRAELKRTGADTNNVMIDRILSEFRVLGFVTVEGKAYHAVKGMKVRIVEA